MQNNIMFDSVYIGHSVEDAEKLAEESWKPKHDAEKLLIEADKPKSKPESPLDLKFTDDPITYIKEKVDLFVTIAQKDPLQAVQFVPEVAGGVVLSLLVLSPSSRLSPALARLRPRPPRRRTARRPRTRPPRDPLPVLTPGKAEVTKRNTRSQKS